MDTAEVEIVPPPEAMRPFVRRCLYANRWLDAPLDVRPKPTGYIYFVDYFGRSPDDFVMVDGRKFAIEARCYFAGQITSQDIAVHHADRHQVLYCELSATATHRLFGIPGKRLTGIGAPLGQIAGAEFDALAKKCFASGPEASRDDHFAEMSTFIATLAAGARPPDPVVEDAVAMFESANGAIRVAEVCRRLGVSPRLLNRRFTDIVGISPKFFGQVMQINWVVGLLYFNDSATLTEIAQDAGFFDQAHFNYAMRRFFSEGPSEFLRSDHVLFKTFLGSSRHFGPTAPTTDGSG